MKSIIILFLSAAIMYAQSEHDAEILVNLINTGTTWNITIQLTAVSDRWDENNRLTENYETASYNLYNPWLTAAYFDHIKDPEAGNNPIFALGLYKVSAIEGGIERAYFYLDYRTADETWNGSIDVSVKYDITNRRFRNWEDTQTLDRNYLPIWDLIQGMSYETVGLEDFWIHSLVVTVDPNNHPRLVWGPYPTENITGYTYQVWRKNGALDWAIKETVSDYKYTDNLTFGASYEVLYKIRATKSQLPDNWYSGYSNTVSIIVSGSQPGKINVKPDNKYDYNLDQNYPNRFNPLTIIKWQMPTDDFVSLRVFDMIGQEVATLVNEFKQAGEHSVQFEAGGMPSGIYICRIQIGSYEAIRKIVLQK